MKAWLLGIVLTSLAAGLAGRLAPQGREQAMVRLVSGLLLALAILRPLAGQDWDAPALDASPLFESASLAGDYRKIQQESLAAIIAEKTEAYICDKANRLGLACTVTVTTAAGESGVPLPDGAAVRGPYSEALAVFMEEEVGIPAGKQIWLEDDEWQTKMENEN